MALAPWDLISWQSLSDTTSFCEPLNAGVRRESYLRATRTPNNGVERNDSFRLYSGNMTPVVRTRASSSNYSSNKPSAAKIDEPRNGVSEVYRTPSGTVSLVITDHSTIGNGNAIQPMTPPPPSPPTSSDQTTTSPKDSASSPKIRESDDISESPVTPEPSAPAGRRPLPNGRPFSLAGPKLEPVAENRTLPAPARHLATYQSRDIFILCIVFIFAFSAVRAVQVLQSSINDRGKLGIMALSLFYLSLAITVVLLPPFCQNLSDRTLLLTGIFLLFVWLAANLLPHPFILLPAAVLGGAGLTLSWTAQMNAFAAYFSNSSQELMKSQKSQDDSKLSLKRFLLTNNTLFALFQSSHIWGNLSVATILLAETRANDSASLYRSAITVKVIAASNRSLEYNLTIGPGWYFSPPLFRVDIMQNLSSRYENMWAYCKDSGGYMPTQSEWSSMVGFTNFSFAAFPAAWALAWLVTLGFFALLLAAVFFRPSKPVRHEDDEDEFHDASTRLQKFIVAHLFQLFDGPHFRLLIPLLFFNGLEQGFLYTDYTMMFLSCMFGLSSVGVAVMVAGVMSCIFSAAASFAAKRSVSREIVISIAAIVHLALATFLYQWHAYPSIPILVIIVPVIYGFCDAVWQTHCYVLITKVAGNDHQIAFSNFRVLQSLGIATSCLLSFLAGFGLKLSVLVGNLLVSVLCYAILENRIRREELHAKDRERLANALKRLTFVVGAGIHPRDTRPQLLCRTASSTTGQPMPVAPPRSTAAPLSRGPADHHRKEELPPRPPTRIREPPKIFIDRDAHEEDIIL